MCHGAMEDYYDKQFIYALTVPPDERSYQDMEILYAHLRDMEALCWLREPALRALCHTVRYETHDANDILYCRGELATCWYILLSGAVFIEGSMFLPRSSFGKRSGGGGRRTNECLILEPSEMIVIDYPDLQLMRPGPRSSVNPMNLEKLLALEGREVTISAGSEHHHHLDNSVVYPSAAHMRIPHHQHDPLPDLIGGGSMLRGAGSRGSVGSSVRDGSDTSSAYSGSDTMCHSIHSSIEPEEMDLTGLLESRVDSDEEDMLEYYMESMTLRDRVRECLEKDPSVRTEEDIEVLLEFIQPLKAFSNFTLSVRRALCQAMVYAVVEETGTVLMKHGEELDSWSVIINGHVEVEEPDGKIYEMLLGDSFGITPTMEKLLHNGVMKSKEDNCQFVCIKQKDYYSILHAGEESIRRHLEDGVTVLLTEERHIEACNRKGNIVIKGTPERLMSQLVEVENNVDPTYVEDFLLTHRTFIPDQLEVASKLLEWYDSLELRDRVTRVVILWVNNHFTDFEMDPKMMNFLEQFELGLEQMGMHGQLRLLDVACASQARARTITLTRPSRDEVLHFSIIDGKDKSHGIFIHQVEKGSKAEEVGLKRGDQILEVNNQSFEFIKLEKALEILRSSCHLAITVKSNLFAFKEMLQNPESSPCMGRHLHHGRDQLPLHPDFSSSIGLCHTQSLPPGKKNGTKNGGSFSALLSRNVLKNVINKMMPVPKNHTLESQANSDESLSSHSSVGGTLYHGHSNQDLSTVGYEELRSDFPEHVLKVYRATDQSSRFLPVHKETSAREVVMLALQTFNINDPSGSGNYALYEVTANEDGMVKQKKLPDNLQNLAERIGICSRYYLRNVTSSQPLIPDESVQELIRESQVHFLQLNSIQLALQLTLEDFGLFRKIEATEYIDHLFKLNSKYGAPAFSEFMRLNDKEMFWVVTEVCLEHTLVKRSKIIKQFIKVARQCKDCKNFNSMFAIISGLRHSAVSRLTATWERVPQKYKKTLGDLENYMEPSRNMSKYRELLNCDSNQPPVIPFFPIVLRDLTFAHEGNYDKVDGLINFEKLRMISRYIRDLQNMCSAPYDFGSMQEVGGSQGTALISMNQMGARGQQVATVKRRKKSTAIHDRKKMYEEAQMVRRVKAYLIKLKVETNEEVVRKWSYECEAGPIPQFINGCRTQQSNSAPPTGQIKRHQSPTPSTASTTSSTSQSSEKQPPKFGAKSHQSEEKILSLAEPTTRPHRPCHRTKTASTSSSLSPSPSPGPPRRTGAGPSTRNTHERSRSETPNVPVDLCPESSSVTSLTALHKSQTSVSVSSSSAVDYQVNTGQGESDSGISTQFDYPSSSSLEVGGTYDGHAYHSPSSVRRFAHQPEYLRARLPPSAVAVLPPLPLEGICITRTRRSVPNGPPSYPRYRPAYKSRTVSHDEIQQYYQPDHGIS